VRSSRERCVYSLLIFSHNRVTVTVDNPAYQIENIPVISLAFKEVCMVRHRDFTYVG
jgi:hypothetical protein